MKIEQQKRRLLRGYSLMELVVVILILAIMSGIAIPTIGNFIERSKIEVTEQEMVDLIQAIVGNPKEGISGYRGDVGALPPDTTTDPLEALYDFNAAYTHGSVSPYNPFTRTGWNGPYVDLTRADVADPKNGVVAANEYEIIYDAWGHAYDYNEAAGTITSYGPDGASGGGDDIVMTIE